MTHYSLSIPKNIVETVYTHAQAGLPNEACGYLGGNDGVVRTFYPMTNVDASPEHFSFDPKEQFAVVKEARAKKEELIGVYHSHPETPARLSEEDIKLFNDPNPTYVIVSLKNKEPTMNGFKVFKPSDDEIQIFKVEMTYDN
jgi:[CysO sulfur-carrier protein]-S-L-cysteine hydrolase